MPTATPYLGTRASDNFATDQRPKSWRETILYLWPNGSAPLTAMLAKAKSEKVDDPEFSWFTKVLPTQSVAVTGVYTNSGLSTAYTSGAAADSTLYIKMAVADVKNFRAGHQVLLRDASNYTVDVNAKVTAVTQNGASSYLTLKLLEADDNGVGNDLSNCDTCMIIGNLNEEHATIPAAVAYDTEKLYNYTQIFRTPLKISRTAARTRLRIGPARAEAKRETLELHSIEMEKAFLYGIKTEKDGTGGLPERTTEGMISSIKINAAANVGDYVADSTLTWANGGLDWFNEQLEQIFRYGSKKKQAFCGSGALLGINRLAMSAGTVNLNVGANKFGIAVTNWVTPFGELELMTHPLFSHEATTRNDMLIFEMGNIRYRFVDDTMFIADERDKVNRNNSRDGFEEEWLTEAGLEFHHPITGGILHGVGLNG